MSSHMPGAHYGTGRKMFCWASFRAPSTGAGPCENCEQCTIGNKADTIRACSKEAFSGIPDGSLRPFIKIDAKIALNLGMKVQNLHKTYYSHS